MNLVEKHPLNSLISILVFLKENQYSSLHCFLNNNDGDESFDTIVSPWKNMFIVFEEYFYCFVLVVI